MFTWLICGLIVAQFVWAHYDWLLRAYIRELPVSESVGQWLFTGILILAWPAILYDLSKHG